MARTGRKRETPVHEIVRLDARYAEGKSIRSKVSRKSHAGWKPSGRRPDPVTLLERSSAGRVPELVPIPYGRMLQTPFTFFRGAAAIMADDLSSTPASGIRVQACGDCQLLNVGGFATPERRLIFDMNDFDETLPAPWEWDLKRLATSFVVASRSNGFKPKCGHDAAAASVAAYRRRMNEYAAMRSLDVWYASIDSQVAIDVFSASRRALVKKRVRKLMGKSVAHDDFPELAQFKQGRPVIKDNPPLIYHQQIESRKQYDPRIAKAFALYRESLPEDRRSIAIRSSISR
jgi:Uncharacterized protein conserved in bacteria (DUF2252)